MASAHHAAQHSRYPPPPPPNSNNDFRLPSLKDLNFQYRPPPSGAGPTAQESSPVPASAQIEQNSSRQDHSTRQTSSSWGRPAHVSYPPQYASYSPAQPPQPPPPSYHQVQPAPPPPHEQIHHPGPGSSHPAYNYQHPQQYLQPRTHNAHQQPHQQPPHQQPSHHSHHNQQQQHPAQRSPYPHPTHPLDHHHQQQQQQQQSHPQPHPLPQQHPQQPQQPQHPQHHIPSHQQQHQVHQQQMAFSRTTALVPTNLDTRAASFSSGEVDKASARDSTMSEIVRHCTTLYSFASRYAQLQANQPRIQPPPAEMVEMTHRASQVVRHLEELRRMTIPDTERAKFDTSATLTSGDDHRPPKRPWEDPSQDGAPENIDTYPSSERGQSTAEQDMEIIRTKRATTTAGGPATSGQPKSKYRKRSRATPPGKCHSCNIRETPEWRRGPDGARTLCNACGLHYAKLMRKREKAYGSGANDAPRIDMDMLRASARAADLADKNLSLPVKQQPSQTHSVNESTSPAETPKQLPQHHQGSFQLLPTMMSTAPSSEMGSRVPAHNAAAPMAIPPPPWATSAPPGPGGRGYPPDQLQHQSFMRTSQHRPSNGTSPR